MYDTDTTGEPSARRQLDGADARAELLEASLSRWGDTVLRLAVNRTDNRSDAEDVFQTVFMRLYQAAPHFTDDEHEKAWLLRVTMNCCADIHRSPWRKHRAAYDDEAAATIPAPPATHASGLANAALAQALARLTGKQRAAVHLHYYEGYSTEEIAQITGEQPATVRSHLHRARKALKIELGAQNE